MNPIDKLNLQDKIKETNPDIDSNIIYKVLTALEKLEILPELWNNDSLIIKEKTVNALPKTLKIVTPMWQGIVYLVKKENYFGYQDEFGNVRVYDKTEKGLVKKINKYKK
jgi:hypothetical protein